MNQRGVGLIDIMIATIIIGGGLLALSRLQGIQFTTSSAAKQQSEAGFIAQGVIENLRTRSWSDPELGVGEKALPDTPGKSATYSVKYTVSQPNAQHKNIQVVVSWRDNNGQTLQSKLVAIFQQSDASGTARLLQLVPSGSGSSSSGSSSSSSQSNSASSVSKGNK